ncbi:extracellular solute-binding protein [Natronospirillum operosum]|uniref:Extracellular solute-binding protein n=1 Tax=Natronospirillum operosum TaxID=2759953 RepID=A0A4Z0W982_9GAMM|nr:extracellular solute-binding protein [Natronospirillum operosum]TGG93569.1 extracellular solute-binding protein [Natronospirillum operosum]
MNGTQRFRKLAAGVAIATALAGYAHAEVTVLGWPGGPEETALRAAAQAYNALPDTAADEQVSLLFFNRDGFFDKLQADMAAGTDAFDANLLATYSIGRYAPFMEPIELDPGAADVFGDTVLETMQFEGEQYGVPLDLSAHFMYYRTDLIDALLEDESAHARYSAIAEEYLGQAMAPKHPDDWTWDDYVVTSLYFTQAVNRDSPVRYGTVLQMQNLLFNMMVFHSYPRAYGADWMDADGTITVDSDAYRLPLERYKMLLDAGATPRDSLSYEFPEANAAYNSGQVAVMLQWNGAAGELMDPDNAMHAENVAVVAPPAGPEGRFTHIHGLGLGLNENARNPEGARKFLEWLSTEDAAVIYARNSGAPGLTGNALARVADDRPDLVQLGEFASSYGFVMNGGTSASALSVYEAQAQAFTGYWAGTQTLDEALRNVERAMADLLE